MGGSFREGTVGRQTGAEYSTTSERVGSRSGEPVGEMVLLMSDFNDSII